MKKLYLLRHAKSCWDSGVYSDHDRPLNKRGYRDANRIGKKLKAMNIEPDLVLCSTALRTRETLEVIQKSGKFQWDVQFDKRLYGASAHTIISIVKEAGAKADSIMVVGHNPGIEYVALTLAAKGETALFDCLHEKVPTGSFIVLEFDVAAFSGIIDNSASLTAFMRPKIEFAD